MANQTEIANMALARLGSEDIMSLSDSDDENARVANRFFDAVTKEVLRSHQWSSATKRVGLTQLTDAPDFGWEVQYLLPTDFVRAIYLNDTWVWDPHDDWVIEGDQVLTDETTANLVYIFYDGITTTKFDPLLVEAIAAKLAYRMGPVLTGDQGISRQLAQEYEMALARARTADAQETNSNENYPLLNLLNRSTSVSRRYASNLG